MSDHSIVDQVLAEPQMNATPLIDVLLVLLVMLIFALPIATHAVKVNLPQLTSERPAPVMEVLVDFDGRLHFNGREHTSIDTLEREFRGLSAAQVVRVTPDRRTPYDIVARVLAAAQRAQVGGLAVAAYP
jgi:biopolymer transport protein ExbD